MSDDFIYKLVVVLIVLGAMFVLSMVFWLRLAEENIPMPVPDEYLPYMESEFPQELENTKG